MTSKDSYVVCKHENGLFPEQLVYSVIFLRCNDCGKIIDEIPQEMK